MSEKIETAVSLLPGWEVRRDSDVRNVRADRADGSVLWFRERLDGRIEIHGSWPRDPAGRYVDPRTWEERKKAGLSEITVSDDSSPERIAKEISRRLLPMLDNLAARALTIIAREAEFERETEETRKAIGLDGEGRYLHCKAGIIEVSVSGSTVGFPRLSCDLEIALRVIAALRGE